MNRTSLITLILIVCAAVLIVRQVNHSKPNTETSPAQPSVPQPADLMAKMDEAMRGQIEKVGPSLYRIGRVRVDGTRREITAPGQVNMNNGLIEVVACTPYGKVHESLLVLPVRPLNLHIACLLLGLKAGFNPIWMEYVPPDKRPPDWQNQLGDSVEVWVDYHDGVRTRSIRVEQCLMDKRTSESLPATQWIFTGSWVDEEGFYAADGIGSIVTNYNDSSAVIDCPLPLGRVDDYTFAIPAALPERGTTISLRIIPVASNTGMDE